MRFVYSEAVAVMPRFTMRFPDAEYLQELSLRARLRLAIRHWLPVMAASVLLHIIVLFGVNVKFATTPPKVRITKTPIDVILLKAPQPQTPMARHLKAATPAPTTAGKSVSKNVMANGALNNNVRLKSGSRGKTVHKSFAPNQARGVKTVDKNEENKHPKRDWNAIAKEVIRENFDQETMRNERQGELWLKSPSVMHGKPRDFFDKQDKRAMLADNHEKKSLFPTKKPKSDSQVIRIGKLCFLRPTFNQEEDIRADRTVVGSLISVSCNH